MAVSGFEGSRPAARNHLSGRLAASLLLVSFAYVSVAMIKAPEISTVARGMIFPLKLFLIASLPTVGGIAFLCSDRATDDIRRRRLSRILLVMLGAVASIALVSVISR